MFTIKVSYGFIFFQNVITKRISNISLKTITCDSQFTFSRPRTDHSALNRFFAENCVALTVLLHELCKATSSFSRTVSTAQFLSKNCGAEVCGASIFYYPWVRPVPEVKPVPPVRVSIFTKYFSPLSWPL